MKRILALGITISVLVTFWVVTQDSPSHGQQSGKRVAAPPSKSASQTNSDASALVGQFGYKIQIPEMPMKRIGISSKSELPVSVPQQSTPLKSIPVPDKIVTKEAPAQPVETPKLPEAQKPVEPVNVMKVEKSESPSWLFVYIGYYNFIQELDKLKFSPTFFMLLIFVLVAAAGFSTKNGYVVIKNKNGVCRVIKTCKKTSSTIAGPFKTKERAKKAMEKAKQEASLALMTLPERDFVQLKLPIRCFKIVPSSQPTMSKITLTGDADLFGDTTSNRKTG